MEPPSGDHATCMPASLAISRELRSRRSTILRVPESMYAMERPSGESPKGPAGSSTVFASRLTMSHLTIRPGNGPVTADTRGNTDTCLRRNSSVVKVESWFVGYFHNCPFTGPRISRTMSAWSVSSQAVSTGDRPSGNPPIECALIGQGNAEMPPDESVLIAILGGPTSGWNRYASFDPSADHAGRLAGPLSISCEKTSLESSFPDSYKCPR